jgi:hypothetical protein
VATSQVLVLNHATLIKTCWLPDVHCAASSVHTGQLHRQHPESLPSLQWAEVGALHLVTVSEQGLTVSFVADSANAVACPEVRVASVEKASTAILTGQALATAT